MIDTPLKTCILTRAQLSFVKPVSIYKASNSQMQEKKLTRAKKVIDALRHHYGEKVGEFAKRLDVAASTVSTWANRDTLDEDLIFRKCEGVRFEFLKSGEGEMFQNKFQQVGAAAAGHAVHEARANYPHLAGELPPMVVTQISRPATPDEQELLGYFILLGDEQKVALLSVARAMAAGVPGKSQKSDPTDKNLTRKRSA